MAPIRSTDRGRLLVLRGDANDAVELAQAADPLSGRRVRHEERRDAGARERVDRVQRGGGGIDAHRDRLRSALEVLERVRERGRPTQELRARRVCEVLAL